MKYKCLACNFTFDYNPPFYGNMLKNTKAYSCPNCGNYIFDTKITEKIQQRMHQLKDTITQDDIQRIINEQKKILDNIKNTPLEKVKKYLVALLNLIQDPGASLPHKIIAAAAIFYVINPVDAIPDVFPGIGLLDDVIAVLIAVAFIGVALNKYVKTENNQAEINTLLYLVQPDSVSINTIYSEKNGLRVWKLHPEELKDYDLNIINNNLIESPKLYISHPYFYKTLLPAEDFDRTIDKLITNEEIKLLSAFGAKTIKIKKHEFIGKSFDAKLDPKLCNDAIKGKVDIKGQRIINKEESHTLHFGQIEDFAPNVIDELVWYFTNKNNFETVIFNRICNELKRETCTFESSTLSFLKLELRAKIQGFKTGFNSNCEGAIYKKVEYDIEFYPRPKAIRENAEQYYENIRERLNQRRHLLYGAYKKLENERV